MSWTDPCGNCGKHRADCDCKVGYSSTAVDKVSYNRAINNCIHTLRTTTTGGCLCGHFDPCHGGCKPSVSDFIKELEKLKL